MRFKRKYKEAFKRKLDWFVSRFKPLTVHTEAIVIDPVWEEVKKTVLKNNVLKWYIMTPANMSYFRSEFNVRMSKKKVAEILRKRYKLMLENGQRLELHIHLSLIMDNISYKEQDKLFKDAINWMKKELGITPKEFVPGWWMYNEDTLKLCKKYELKMIHERDYDYTHDFDWVI